MHLSNEWLDCVHGGDDEEGGGGGGEAAAADTSTDTSYDTSSNEPAASFDGGDEGATAEEPPGEPEIPEPTILPSDLENLPPGPSERDMVLHRADLAVNYDDPASPPRIYQGDLGNCGVVATINSVAQTPDGQEYLREQARESGAHAPPGAGATGDEDLRRVEASTGYREGEYPHDVLEHLGIDPQNHRADNAVRSYQADPSNPTTLTSRSGGPDYDPEHGVYGNHAYEVVGTYTHPDTGETMVLLRNPHGQAVENPDGSYNALHPRTQINGQYYPGVPMSQVNRLFVRGTNGRG